MTQKKIMTKLYDPKRNRPRQNHDDTRYSVDVFTIDETGMYGIAYFHFAKEEWVFLTDTLVDYDEPDSETEWKWYYPEVKWGEATEDPDPSVFQWTNEDIDAAYIMGALNVSVLEVEEGDPFPSISKFKKETERLNALGFDRPYQAVMSARYPDGKPQADPSELLKKYQETYGDLKDREKDVDSLTSERDGAQMNLADMGDELDATTKLLKEAVERNEELTSAFHRLIAEFKTVDADGNKAAHLSKNRYEKLIQFLTKHSGRV